MTALASPPPASLKAVAVKETSGTPFDITLTADGNAISTQEKAMTGTWKEEGGAAVISWTTGSHEIVAIITDLVH